MGIAVHKMTENEIISSVVEVCILSQVYLIRSQSREFRFYNHNQAFFTQPTEGCSEMCDVSAFIV